MKNLAAEKKSRSIFCRGFLFALTILFVGYIRLRVLQMPLERDEGEYAYAGQLILQGIPPYELAYNMKLPGTYFAYALGMEIFGQTVSGIHLALLAANSLAIIFVFLLARKLFGNVAGIISCMSYGVMSVSPTVLGMAAHANHFVVLFAVPAIWLLLIAEEKKSNGILFFSGLLFGSAFFMTQQGIFFGIFGGIFLLWRALAEKTILSRTFAKKIALFAAAIILPLAIFCLICLCRSDFNRFWFWTFSYASRYATLLPFSDGVQQLKQHLRETFNISLGFCILAAIGISLAAFDKNFRQPMIFVLIFWLFSFFGTAAGFYFRGHYFILVLPAFSILIGAGIVSLQSVLKFRILTDLFQTLPLILFAGILNWVIFYQAQFFFQLSPIQISRSIYQLNPNEESLAAGNFIRTNSAPETKIAVVGSEPEIYFYAHRHSATGYIYTYALMENQPAAAMMQREMISEIETNRPEFLVFVPHTLSWLPHPQSSRKIFNWFDKYSANFYSEIAVVGFDKQNRLLVLQNGDLQKTNELSEQPLEIFKRKSN